MTPRKGGFSWRSAAPLPHLRDTLAAVLSQAAKEQWTYLEFLDQILRSEVDAKQGNGSCRGCRSPTSLVSGPSRGLTSHFNPQRTSG